MRQVRYINTRQYKEELKSLLLDVYGKNTEVVDKHLTYKSSYIVGAFVGNKLVGAFGGRLISDKTIYLDINLLLKEYRLKKTFFAMVYYYFKSLETMLTNYEDLTFTGVLDNKPLEKRLINKHFFTKIQEYLFFNHKDIKGVINVVRRNG